jgi:hypothetical protein
MGGDVLSNARNRKKLYIVPGIAMALFSVAGIQPVFAQQSTVAPPASTPNKPQQVWVRAAGGNHGFSSVR